MEFKEKTLKVFCIIAFFMITLLVAILCIPITMFVIQEIKAIMSNSGGVYHMIQIGASIVDIAICIGVVYAMKFILIRE